MIWLFLEWRDRVAVRLIYHLHTAHALPDGDCLTRCPIRCHVDADRDLDNSRRYHGD